MRNLSADRDSSAGIFRRGPRGTIDIIADILSLCGSSAGRTSIMYKANLSHQMLKFYLWHMVELGLLEESDDSRFTITEKGRQFQACYREIGNLLAGMGGTGKHHFPSQNYVKSLR